jgi:hypothetical protein
VKYRVYYREKDGYTTEKEKKNIPHRSLPNYGLKEWEAEIKKKDHLLSPVLSCFSLKK